MYPFKPEQHPYPPLLSYPSAPPHPDQHPQPSNPSYPPYSTNPAPYPNNSTPYPSVPTPYPNPNISTPFPNPSMPYPSPYPNPSAGPYPNQSVPYPVPGYPNQPGTFVPPYPNQPGTFVPPYPNQPASYPNNNCASTSYPQQSMTSAMPTPHPVSSHPPHLDTLYPSLGHAPSPPHHTVKTNPTLKPSSSFNPRNDAEVLRKAMKGFGTDEAAIISVLGHRTNAERLEIAKEFKTLYGKDLIKDLKSETSGKFEQLLLALLTPLPRFYAEELHHAISGVGTNESTLIEVMCTLTNSQINCVKEEYKKLHKKDLEDDLRSDTSGNFKRLLVSLCTGHRDENSSVSNAAVDNDAQALHRAGELRFGTDESVFNAILCSRSLSHLQSVFEAYAKLAGHPLEKAIKSEFSGDIEDGLLAIVQCVRNKAVYLAERLYKSMAGAGTNDRALIRLIVTRSEIDLEDIKKEFSSKYGKSLESYLKGDTSGDYKKLLLALAGY